MIGAELVGECHQHGFGLGEQDDPAGLGVEPMSVIEIHQTTFGDPGFSGGDGVVQQAHQIGPGGLVAIGRREQAGGFVECEQVRVFEDDGNFPELAGGGRGKLDSRAHGKALNLGPGADHSANGTFAESLA